MEIPIGTPLSYELDADLKPFPMSLHRGLWPFHPCLRDVPGGYRRECHPGPGDHEWHSIDLRARFRRQRRGHCREALATRSISETWDTIPYGGP